MEKSESISFSRNVVEFVAVANEFCRYVEHSSKFDGAGLLAIFQRVLPLLYIKGSLLPSLEPFFDDGNEKFVTEDDWNSVYDTMKGKLGANDEYLEVFDEKTELSGSPVISSIAEDIADIYQDMKDFLLLYQTGTEEVMNDAVWECKLNFETLWGQKLVNSLRAIHKALYSSNDDNADSHEGHHHEGETHHHHCDDDECSCDDDFSINN